MAAKLCLQNRIALVDIRPGWFTGPCYCSADSELAELESSNKEPG